MKAPTKRNFKRRDDGANKPARPIDKHGAYEGTDVGFTSDSIEDPHPKHKLRPRAKKKAPIDRHGNYDGTDVGFTRDEDD